MKFTIRRCWYLVVELVVVLALLVTAFRFVLPMLDEYKGHLSAQLSQMLGQQVSVEGVKGRWHGFGPLIELNHVVVNQGDGRHAALAVSEVEIGLNLWDSLVSWQIIFDRIQLRGLDISLERRLDGSISLQGFSDQDVSGDNSGGANGLDWFFSQRLISVGEATLRWRDQTRPGVKREVRHVNFTIRNDTIRHQLSGDARIGPDEQPDVRFALDLTGDLSGTEWRGKGYLESVALKLGPWLSGQMVSDVVFLSGQLGLQVWTTWEEGKLADSRGQFEIRDLGLRGTHLGVTADGTPDLRVEHLSGAAFWKRTDDGWAFAVPELTRGEAQLPSALIVSARHQTGGTVYDLQLDHVDIRQIIELSRIAGDIPADLGVALHQAGMSGDIENFHGRFQTGDAVNFALQGRLSDVRSSGSGKVPGFGHLQAQFFIDQGAGLVDLELGDTELVTNGLFREPLPLRSVETTLAWQKEGPDILAALSDMVLETPEVRGKGNLGLFLPDGASPHVNLRFDLSAPGGLAHVSRYLPASAMSHESVEWLDRALINGDVAQANVTWEGALDAFPYTDGLGVFSIATEIRHGNLDFAPDWPRLTDIDASLTFKGDGLTIEARSGQSLGLVLSDVKGRITDLYGDQPELKLAGKASGNTGQMLSYIRQSPVRNLLGEIVSGMTGTGQNHLDLSLDVPLMHSLDTRVQGRLGFKGSSLMLSESGFEIDKITGDLEFTEKDVHAERMRVNLLGLDSLLDIFPHQKDDGTGLVTRLRASGKVSSGALNDILGGLPEGVLDGETSWQAHLDLGHDHEADPWLEVSSDLQGLALGMPAPLKKPAGEQSRFSLALQLPQRIGRPAKIGLGDSLHGILDLDQNMKIQRSTLHWGDGQPALVKGVGMRVTGSLDLLDLDPWLEYISRPEIERSEPEPGQRLSSVNLQAGRFMIAGHAFPDQKLSGERAPDSWMFHLMGPDVSGQVQVPVPLGDKALLMAFDHLILGDQFGTKSQGAARGQRRTDPGNIPPLEITSKNLSFSGMDLGSMKLSTVPVAHGMDIRELSLVRPEARFDIHGKWTDSGSDERTRLSLRFVSQDLGQSMVGLGFPGLFSQGTGKVESEWEWAGSPADFDWSFINGKLSALLQGGRVLEIEPGAGRIVGLFSLRSLPRRIFLDFSDVLRRGYAYDRIEGSFIVREGVAETDNLYLEGPSARIEVKGATDLVARQYNQDVEVMPHFGSSLPVAGALAGGLGVGAAVLIFERVFQSDLEQMTRIRYHVSGPWDKPTVTSVEVKGKNQ